MCAQKIKIVGFLNEFKRRHDQLKDRPFCWVLGSGASVQSGIPAGTTLANQWLTELHELEDFGNLPIETWATAERLGIPNFEFSRAENFYPWIYQRRFRDYKEQGYAFLENAMDHTEPSFGYSVLAQIMATTAHKIAVTTNFDNLIADALSIYTRTFPLVCGHESLTGYIRPNLRRPLIAKIHRDLLLAPLSNPDEIAKLPGEWASALTKIFDRFTPIVIGYGGNDGSLMGFLKTITPIEGGMFWCYREGSEIDSEIHRVVDQHRGRLVPIAGFDEVMLQLQEKLQLSFLLPQLQAAHDKRVTSYQKQFETLTASLRKPAENPAAEEARKSVREAAEAAVERLTKEKDWWAWQLKADAEQDIVKQEAIYRAGLADFPKSAELTGNFALFMDDIRGDYDEAELLYRKTLELDPNDANATGNFAVFMQNVRKDNNEAERLFRRALELAPYDATATGNFARFMEEAPHNYDEAERLYRKAMDLGPMNANTTSRFAMFMESVRKEYDEAERLYRMALELDPGDADNTGLLALFMDDVRNNYDEAEQLYRQALTLDPEHVNNIGNFAQFLDGVRENYDEAEVLYRKAMELEPNDAEFALIVAEFLASKREDHDEAERIYRNALQFAPENAKIISGFAWFMGNVRANDDEAERLYCKAVELDPKDAEIAASFAEFLKEKRKQYDEAENFYRKALELDPEDPDNSGNLAVFMERVRQDYNAAEGFYRRALELDPNDSSILANYSQFQSGAGQISEARKTALRAWALLDEVPHPNHAEVLFTLWILNRVSGLAGAQVLGRLKYLLEEGFERTSWTFDRMLATLLPKLPESERPLAQKLADAILDESKSAALEQESLWRAAEPIPDLRI